jgi:hypothetical protein
VAASEGSYAVGKLILLLFNQAVPAGSEHQVAMLQGVGKVMAAAAAGAGWGGAAVSKLLADITAGDDAPPALKQVAATCAGGRAPGANELLLLLLAPPPTAWPTAEAATALADLALLHPDTKKRKTELFATTAWGTLDLLMKIVRARAKLPLTVHIGDALVGDILAAKMHTGWLQTDEERLSVRGARVDLVRSLVAGILTRCCNDLPPIRLLTCGLSGHLSGYDHTWLAVVDVSKGTLSWLDPCIDNTGINEERAEAQGELLDALIGLDPGWQEAAWKPWDGWGEGGVPQQVDSSSCSLMVCRFIEAIAAGAKQPPAVGTETLRLRAAAAEDVVRFFGVKDAPHVVVDA